MSRYFWSFLLQYSRVGLNALVFLLAARFLTLSEIGLFATAYAPIRLTQGLHKSGITEMVVIRRATQRRLNALFWLSLSTGIVLSTALLCLALLIGNTALLSLSLLPLLHGLGALGDGLLRKALALRALALRSLIAQVCAALVCLWALTAGWGSGALILFVTCNAALTTLLNLRLARWRPTGWPSLADQLLTSRKTAQIAARDLLNSAIMPLAQLAIGLLLGLPAAGAFQIAARLIAMLEALSLAPLRYLALPQFAAQPAARHARLQHSLRLNSRIAGWVWFLALATAPEMLPFAIGKANAAPVLPIFIALLPLGVIAALAMPLTQALTARGTTGPVLTRALLTLGLSTLLCGPALTLSAPLTAAALSVAALLSLICFLHLARPHITLSATLLRSPLPPLLSGAAMALILLCLPLGLFADLLLGTAIYALFVVGFTLPVTQRHIA